MAYSEGDSAQITYTYNSNGERETERDPLEFTTTYTVDAWGNPTTILGPEDSLTTFTHDIRSRRISMTDPLGREAEYTFDPLDYPEKIIHPEFTAHPLPAGSTSLRISEDCRAVALDTP